MAALHDAPDDPTVYIARAYLLQEMSSFDPEADLRKAMEVNDSDRRTWLHLHRYYEAEGRRPEALALSETMVDRFGNSFVVRLAHARSLLRMMRPLEAIEILRDTNVLPAEGAGGGRELFTYANIAAGLEEQFQGDGCSKATDYYRTSLEWPEHLGQGKPYVPEERLSRFLIAGCEAAETNESGKEKAAKSATEELQRVADARRAAPSPADLISYQALMKLNREGDARALTRELAQASGTDPVAQWVLSRIRDDGSEQDLLQRHPALVEMLDTFMVGLTADLFGF
jgi:predicted Zn-dependent protease